MFTLKRVKYTVINFHNGWLTSFAFWRLFNTKFISDNIRATSNDNKKPSVPVIKQAETKETFPITHSTKTVEASPAASSTLGYSWERKGT